MGQLWEWDRGGEDSVGWVIITTFFPRESRTFSLHLGRCDWKSTKVGTVTWFGPCYANVDGWEGTLTLRWVRKTWGFQIQIFSRCANMASLMNSSLEEDACLRVLILLGVWLGSLTPALCQCLKLNILLDDNPNLGPKRWSLVGLGLEVLFSISYVSVVIWWNGCTEGILTCFV